MRRLCIILLCGLVAVPAAVAASRATGDGTFELQTATGTFSISGTRGTLWGQIAKGRLIATDPVAGDGSILISGADTRKVLAPNATLYIGKDMHFRVTGGRYKLWLRGTDVDLAAVGIGTAQVTADPDAVDPGDYALDGGKWISVPLTQRSLSFGVSQTP
jgi:hypothetical protein